MGVQSRGRPIKARRGAAVERGTRCPKRAAAASTVLQTPARLHRVGARQAPPQPLQPQSPAGGSVGSGPVFSRRPADTCAGRWAGGQSIGSCAPLTPLPWERQVVGQGYSHPPVARHVCHSADGLLAAASQQPLQHSAGAVAKQAAAEGAGRVGNSRAQVRKPDEGPPWPAPRAAQPC